MRQFKAKLSPQKTDIGIEGSLEPEWRFRVDVLEHWLIRVSLSPDEGLAVDRTWMIAPEGDTPWEGNPRLVTKGFSLPEFSYKNRNDRVELETKLLRIELNPDSLGLLIHQRQNDSYSEVLNDRETGSYYLTNRGKAVRHYQDISNGARHFGLGDKTGPLDRTGRRFRLLQLDALGFNAETSDPLYKHIPFLVVQNSSDNSAVGLLYDSMSEMVFDLGCEHSNYHRRYRNVEVAERGLVYYVIAGPRIAYVLRRLRKVIGRPHLPPRWSMGFAFTSMHHADAPRAQKVIEDFADRCRKEEIPISTIHFGSGYTTRKGLRYVFTWNRSKFPDTSSMFSGLRKSGLHTVANIKPVLLLDHPDYADAAANGYFIQNGDNSPAVGRFWDAEGSYLDFSNSECVNWWQQRIRDNVLDEGFDAVWNDNNETEIWDETATIKGFGSPIAACDSRPLQSLLMTRASFEASVDRNPDLRPFTVTRSGPLGIHRYAETWTGDNQTSWHTLKWNLYNGLSLGLSGIPFIGHDIGGFAGPKPDAELLVRWFQMMALHPRCIMNSWKPDLKEPTNLPWMHPKVTGFIRDTLNLRYRFLPYLYSLAYEAHVMGDPIIRPLFYDYDDAQCYQQSECFLLGKDVIVAPIVHPGMEKVPVYLPENIHGWYDYHSELWYEGGRTVELEAELARLPLIIQGGAVLPQAASWETNSPHDAKTLQLTVYSPTGSTDIKTRFFYDDGLTWKYRKTGQSIIRCGLVSDQQRVLLSSSHSFSEPGGPNLQAKFVGAGKRNTEFIVDSKLP